MKCKLLITILYLYIILILQLDLINTKSSLKKIFKDNQNSKNTQNTTKIFNQSKKKYFNFKF